MLAPVLLISPHRRFAFVTLPRGAAVDEAGVVSVESLWGLLGDDQGEFPVCRHPNPQDPMESSTLGQGIFDLNARKIWVGQGPANQSGPVEIELSAPAN